MVPAIRIALNDFMKLPPKWSRLRDVNLPGPSAGAIDYIAGSARMKSITFILK
jgi:hypothetical protein